MRLVADYPHDEFVTLGGVLEASLRVRIFEPDPRDPDGRAAGPVVVLTHDQPTSEPAEDFDIGVVAAEVLVRFALGSSQTAFVEHRPRADAEAAEGLPDAYCLLTFERDEPELRRLHDCRFALTLGEPARQPLSPALVEGLLARQASSQEGGGR